MTVQLIDSLANLLVQAVLSFPIGSHTIYLFNFFVVVKYGKVMIESHILLVRAHFF